MQPFWNDNLITNMPAGLIEDQDDLFVWPCTYCLREFPQRHSTGDHRDHRQQQPEGLTTRWTDKAVQIQPFVAMLDSDDRTLPFASPHASDDRLEANPMFVHSPLFYAHIRMVCGDFIHSLWKRFF
jgi:hypothetical protein